MLTMFKNHCKNIVAGGMAGAAIGAAAGSAAGQMGLNQACGVPHVSSGECSYIHDHADGQAVKMGAVVGAAVGFGVGAVVYPVYKGIVGWCCNNQEQRTPAMQMASLSDEYERGDRPTR